MARITGSPHAWEEEALDSTHSALRRGACVYQGVSTTCVRLNRLAQSPFVVADDIVRLITQVRPRNGAESLGIFKLPPMSPNIRIHDHGWEESLWKTMETMTQTSDNSTHRRHKPIAAEVSDKS